MTFDKLLMARMLVLSLVIAGSMAFCQSDPLVSKKIDSYLANCPNCNWNDLSSSAEVLAERGHADSSGLLISCAVRLLTQNSERLREINQFDSAIVAITQSMEDVFERFGGSPCEACCDSNRSIVYCKIYSELLLQKATYQNGGGYYAEAEKGLREVIENADALPDSTMLGNGLHELQNILGWLERLDEQSSILKRLLDIDRSTLGKIHEYVAFDLTNLAELQLLAGQAEEADAAFAEALLILDSLEMVDPELQIEIRNQYARHLRRLGRYAESRGQLDLILNLINDEAKIDSLAVAHCLTSQCLLFQEMRLFDEAQTACEKALAIRKLKLTPSNLLMAQSYDNLALVLRDIGNPARAAELSTKALEIRIENNGETSGVVALSLNNLALALEDMQRYDTALVLYHKSLELRRTVYGDSSAYTARCLRNLAVVYYKKGMIDSALVRWEDALAATKIALGSHHAEYANGLALASSVYRAAGKLVKAESAISEAFDIRHHSLQESFPVLTEQQALRSSLLLRRTAQDMCNVHFDMDHPTSLESERVIESIISAKGIVTDEVFVRLHNRSESTSNQAAKNYELRRQYLLSQITRLEQTVPARVGTQSTDSKIDSLRQLLRKADIEYSTLIGATQHQQRIRPSCEVLTKSLPNSSMLIEYYRLDRLNLYGESIGSRYVAAVMPSSGGCQLINLGAVSTIDSVVTKYRQHVYLVSGQEHLPTSTDDRVYRELANLLYELIIEPIEKVINLPDRLFLAPDAALNLVSFAGLVDDSGKYLVESHQLQYLSAGRDLIRLQDPPSNSHGLFALGDPDYDASVSQRQSSPESPYRPETAVRPSSMMYNQRSVCDKLSELKVDPLPSTRVEVTEIVNSWKSTTGQQPEYYVGSAASEDRFKAEASGKQVIHLATHGFYLGGECNPGKQKRSPLEETGFVGENPLLQSGLLLAGANLHGKDADSLGVDDGILTAEEVSSLNLDGTRLVVLSACETGLGKVEQGEGVYGLRRAFQMAGARTVVSALWKVDDQTTAEMMKELYRQTDEPIPVRLRNMQLAQIKKLRDEGLPDHPFLWGAFIATGDWR